MMTFYIYIERESCVYMRMYMFLGHCNAKILRSYTIVYRRNSEARFASGPMADNRDVFAL